MNCTPSMLRDNIDPSISASRRGFGGTGMKSTCYVLPLSWKQRLARSQESTTTEIYTPHLTSCWISRLPSSIPALLFSLQVRDIHVPSHVVAWKHRQHDGIIFDFPSSSCCKSSHTPSPSLQPNTWQPPRPQGLQPGPGTGVPRIILQFISSCSRTPHWNLQRRHTLRQWSLLQQG